MTTVECHEANFSSLLYKTNRFHFALRLFSYRSQKTSKCGENILNQVGRDGHDLEPNSFPSRSPTQSIRIQFSLACHESLVAQWLQHPTGVRKVIGFFVTRWWQNEQKSIHLSHIFLILCHLGSLCEYRRVQEHVPSDVRIDRLWPALQTDGQPLLSIRELSSNISRDATDEICIGSL